MTASHTTDILMVFRISGTSPQQVVLGVRVLETLDDNTDVIEYLTAPVPLGGGVWAAPRQFCLARHWRQDDNGCFVVCMDSTPHRCLLSKTCLSPHVVNYELFEASCRLAVLTLGNQRVR